MKKNIWTAVAVMTVALVTSASPLFAEPISSKCPDSSRTCVVKNGDVYCTWSEDAVSGKLVWGRAGQPAYLPVHTSIAKQEKCTDKGHEHGLL